MYCKGCGSESAWAIRGGVDWEICNDCGEFNGPKSTDVYFRAPYYDPNLVDPRKPHQRDGVFVESKEHKVRLLKEQGLREAGDRRNGARNFDKYLADKIKDQGGNQCLFDH